MTAAVAVAAAVIVVSVIERLCDVCVCVYARAIIYVCFENASVFFNSSFRCFSFATLLLLLLSLLLISILSLSHACVCVCALCIQLGFYHHFLEWKISLATINNNNGNEVSVRARYVQVCA